MRTNTWHRIRRGLLALAVIAALANAGPQRPHAARAQDDASWLLEQINGLRAGLGLHAYSLNAQLTAAATQHSQYMATTCDVSHTQSNGSTPASRAQANGYGGNWISENIFMGGSARAVDAWNFWTNSSIHYQGLTHNIVNEIGIGVAHGSCGHGYTLLFGHRGDVSAPPAAPAPGADTGADAGAAQAAPPTERPYVPPPPTRTPTPTIPTLTPSATWTVTPTPSATPAVTNTPAASATSTATPLVLPTVPAVAQLASATPTARPTLTATASPSPTVTPPPDRAPPASESRDVAGWLPVLLLAGAGLLGAAGIVLLRRAR